MTALIGLLLLAGTAAPDVDQLARDFGARPAAQQVRLSPDGTKIVYLAASGDLGTTAIVAELATGKTTAILASQGKLTLRGCNWKTDARLICRVTRIGTVQGDNYGLVRTIAVDADGSAAMELGTYLNGGGFSTGSVLDELHDDPDHVLWDGAGVGKLDVRTNKFRRGAWPSGNMTFGFDSDNHGELRHRLQADRDPNGYVRDFVIHQIKARDGQWVTAGRSPISGVPQFDFLGFDGDANGFYCLKPVDGRQALFHVSADARLAGSLVFKHADVDVDGVLRIGKYNRPVAATYTTDVDKLAYFEPALEKRSSALTAALPGKPPVYILDESWDGRYNLIFAGGITDPGTYHRFDTQTRQLAELVKLRPALERYRFAPERRVTYPAADGTPVPAYLTLPPGVTDPRGLPAIVMPHGGPSARDQLGFDWMAQFYAQLGYAVLKPNYRGSAGYGAAWYNGNGFKSWKTAIADIADGARWLTASGIADPRKLVAVGWSYGGYAVLQTAATRPGLFRAVVAVAPVTDLTLLIKDYRSYSNGLLLAREFKAGDDLGEGSPARHADRIDAPVLIYQGDKDLNVEPEHAKKLDEALTRAGKPHRLVMFPGADHQIDDSNARARMLRESAAFLADAIGK
ncbi:hypothetical protein IP88_07835 [alpha proteobacterium AAP81b]|nr:hypothetical protein IP88_07835 [alpha proteobacterium AAP81b]